MAVNIGDFSRGLTVLVVTAILFIAFYYGIGGYMLLHIEQRHELEVSEKGVDFSSAYIQEILKDNDYLKRIFPHLADIPTLFNFLITSVCFGIIGSIGSVINRSMLNNQKIREVNNILFIPIQGAIIGVIMLGISFLTPIFLTNDDTTLKPIAIVVLSLFGGMFHAKFYRWLESAFDRISQNEK